uniref:Uncharacterized protein n=2 Tax=Deltabaculovirus TaxID=558019 RepID=Q99GQ1_NPVCN|nr:unknown [Culex nigripalpus nucleopolyhedrovirus]
MQNYRSLTLDSITMLRSGNLADKLTLYDHIDHSPTMYSLATQFFVRGKRANSTLADPMGEQFWHAHGAPLDGRIVVTRSGDLYKLKCEKSYELRFNGAQLEDAVGKTFIPSRVDLEPDTIYECTIVDNFATVKRARLDRATANTVE